MVVKIGDIPNMRNIIFGSAILAASAVALSAEVADKSPSPLVPDASVEYAFGTQLWKGDIGMTASFSSMSIRPSVDWSYAGSGSVGLDGAKVTSTLPIDSNLSVYSELSLDSDMKYNDVSVGLTYTFK